MPTKTPTLSPEARRIRAAGLRMYGPRWVRAMAAAIGVSPSLLSMVATGKRPVTADLREKIPAVFERRRKELEKAKADLEAAIREYGED
ncbi:hypothetical protein [Microvirga tunisiensis]|uniref:Transcriptional regulator n=1 Tax=Microvirga tunisiensis TaxID=2108360 RepID=A0A5N7MA06_9HYPH|nr:hypothetical protein [Microvirga tunisiensis]MPR05551.1 hypothetical protein [Microvirga tunisiensis]MPR23751.1 hypothetical protein [Microvirga tunisiensis]